MENRVLAALPECAETTSGAHQGNGDTTQQARWPGTRMSDTSLAKRPYAWSHN
jgi:hypothetical protein